jgi:hypothetical protein
MPKEQEPLTENQKLWLKALELAVLIKGPVTEEKERPGQYVEKYSGLIEFIINAVRKVPE